MPASSASGQQLFLGLGAYFTVKLATGDSIRSSRWSRARFIVGIIASPLSSPMLRLRAAEFAIGMWWWRKLAICSSISIRCGGETGSRDRAKRL